MIFISLLIFFQSLSFAIVPPGLSLIENYNRTLKKIDTAKIESSVDYSIENKNIKETLWFKNGENYRVYVKKGSSSILFIRQSNNCIAISEGKIIKSDDLCNDLSSNVFYNLLLPSSYFFNFFKNAGLEVNLEDNQVRHTDGKYLSPEKVSLARYNSKPVYILGIKQKALDLALKNLKSMPKAVEEIREKSSQVWFDVKEINLIRFYGNLDNLTYELKINNFEEKNKLSFPKNISLDYNGENFYVYKVNDFSFNLKLDNSLFDVKRYETKYTKFLSEYDLNKDQKELLGYLKKFR